MDYPFSSLGPALRILALILLFAFTALGVVALLSVAALPGRIARRRQHPQAPAVNLCGWLGLPTGLGWVIAMIWAHWRYPVAAGSIAAADVHTLAGQLDRLEVAVTQLEQLSRRRTP